MICRGLRVGWKKGSRTHQRQIAGMLEEISDEEKDKGHGQLEPGALVSDPGYRMKQGMILLQEMLGKRRKMRGS